MDIDVLLRKPVFWGVDFVKGGIIKKHYNEIKESYYNGTNEEKVTANIDKLLSHAKRTTKFYSKYNNEINLEDLPVVNKMTYIENYSDFLSTAYQYAELHKMSTSGSTGTPFTVVQDSNKRKRVLAELTFYGKVCGYELGMKQIFFRIWTDKIRKSKFQSWKQNLVMIDISNLDNSRLNEIIKYLKSDKKVKNILSYASTLELLSKNMDKNNCGPNDFGVTSIISSSEILQEDTRKRLKKVFGCPIISRYSNQENGILAQECIDKEEFHLNTSSYYFEFLKLDCDEPAAAGEIARIVVTDLFNYAMPIIRYDTGDTGIVVSKSKCQNKSMILKELYGRRVDIIYDVDGNILSPHVITNNMWGVKGIKQFRFIQESKSEYTIIINPEGNETDNDLIISTFKKVLGDKAIIKIEIVKEIPVLASGKRKYIENKMK